MKSERKSLERRSHKRFAVDDCLVAMSFSSAIRFGRIKEVSMGGLTIRHFNEQGWDTKTIETDILLNGSGMCLEKVSVRIKFDKKQYTPTPFLSLSERLCGVQFEELTAAQSSQLQYFINNYAAEDSTANFFSP